MAVLTGLAAMLALYDRVALWALPVIALLVTIGVTISSFCEELEGQWRIAAAVSIFVLTSALWIVFLLRPAAPVPSFVNTTGTVVEDRLWGQQYVVAVSTPQGGFVVKLPFSPFTEGDRVRIEGSAKPFSYDASDSDFNEDRYWMARGMTAQLTPTKIERAEHAEHVSAWNIHRWRYVLHRSLSRRMPRLTGAYLNSAWTGKHDSWLDGTHRSWGTSHILAVSGFHVGVAMAGASLILKRGKWRVPLLSLILWLYIFLTGAPASAVRAGLMIQTGLIGELVGRPGSSINSVSLAAVLLLMRSPFWFWDVGWRLSVLAALAIAVTIERGRPYDWKIWLLMNFMIWLAIFPQVSWTFETTPLVGLIINLVAPQFFGIALTVASVAAALFMLGVPASSFLLSSVEGVFALWEILADAAASLVPWQLEWNPVAAYCCAALFIMFTCRALFVPWRNVAVLSPLGALSAFALFAL